ncbi:cobalt-precorrin-6A reductase [Xanthobacter sp. V4C-4]|uniref:cobalt-precorrin-6A reductase n=1 Tax=Xanthobacter cornucopiae TaxID=3119924 RepID=UPI00372C34F3
MTVLILGGTSEAAALAKACARLGLGDVMVSLAGRTEAPAALPLPVRVGGFGGAQGLADFLRAEGVAALVDATHPFAARISANAAWAAACAGIPALALLRPGWSRQDGDRWIEVDDLAAAAAALGAAPRRVFLTIGRQGMGAFLAAPQHHYLARSIEPSGVALPRLVELHARGPFDADAEAELMARERIDIVVTKHSGGRSTYGKIEAARRLGLDVVMVRRPARPDLPATGSVEEAVAFVAAHAGAAWKRGV